MVSIGGRVTWRDHGSGGDVLRFLRQSILQQVWCGDQLMNSNNGYYFLQQYLTRLFKLIYISSWTPSYSCINVTDCLNLFTNIVANMQKHSQHNYPNPVTRALRLSEVVLGLHNIYFFNFGLENNNFVINVGFCLK